jgi:ATP-dependent Clp protease ATP-binding subunit ClpA
MMNTEQYRPFTPRVKGAFERAYKIAASYGHAYVGIEHLFLAILREPDGGTVRDLLLAMRANHDQLRDEFGSAMDAAYAQQPPKPANAELAAKLRKLADELESFK